MLCEPRDQLGDLALRRLDLRLQRVCLRLQVVDPVALPDDRAELGELGHRALDAGRRDAERDLRRADPLRRRVVLQRGDAAVVAAGDLLSALGRGRERLDVVDLEAELGLVALELSRGWRDDPGRAAGQRRGGGLRCRRILGLSLLERGARHGRVAAADRGHLVAGVVAREPDHTRRDERDDDRRRHGEREPAPTPGEPEPVEKGLARVLLDAQRPDALAERRRRLGLRRADLVQQRLRHGCSPSPRASSGLSTAGSRPLWG